MHDIKSIHKNLLSFYILIINYQKEKLRKLSHLKLHLKEKIPRNEFKYVKDVHIENYKTLMKETEESTNKWKCLPCSRTRKINIVKLSKLPKAIFRLSAISMKIQMIFSQK